MPGPAARSKPQEMPRLRLNRFVVSMIRASIITCGSGSSRLSMIASTVSMYSGSSERISVLVR